MAIPYILFLEAGQNSLEIKQREDDTKIDRFLLCNDLEYVPEGVGEGPNETGKEPDDSELNIEPAGPIRFWLEAESGNMHCPFETADNGKASSGKFVWTPNGRGNSWDPKQDSDYIAYIFEAPDSGDYIIWGRVYFRSGKGDFFSVGDSANSLWDAKTCKCWKKDRTRTKYKLFFTRIHL